MFNFIFGLIIGGLGVWMLMRRRLDSRLRGNDRGVINPEQMEKKQENLERVLQIAKEKGQIRNDDVQSALGVSDATATRYLDQLEKQGKLVQSGSKKGVIYRTK
jgi:Fic family protein